MTGNLANDYKLFLWACLLTCDLEPSVDRKEETVFQSKLDRDPAD